MQVNEDLVRGEPQPDVLGPQRTSSNSTGFHVVLPISSNPTAAGPDLQMREQPRLPGRPICIVCGFLCYWNHPSHLWRLQTSTTNWWPVSIWASMNEYWCVFSHTFREIWCKKMMKSVDDSRVSGISVMGVGQSPNSVWDLCWKLRILGHVKSLYIVKNIYCEIELGGG